jgi:hypothetical protein
MLLDVLKFYQHPRPARCERNHRRFFAFAIHSSYMTLAHVDGTNHHPPTACRESSRFLYRAVSAFCAATWIIACWWCSFGCSVQLDLAQLTSTLSNGLLSIQSSKFVWMSVLPPHTSTDYDSQGYPPCPLGSSLIYLVKFPSSGVFPCQSKQFVRRSSIQHTIDHGPHL